MPNKKSFISFHGFRTCMKVLFICNQNRHRSKTAEVLFRSRLETASAGLYNEIPVTEEQLQWAEVVVVMEPSQREELGKRYPGSYLAKRILSLDIPDMYQYGQPELMRMLEEKMESVMNDSLLV